VGDWVPLRNAQLGSPSADLAGLIPSPPHPPPTSPPGALDGPQRDIRTEKSHRRIFKTEERRGNILLCEQSYFQTVPVITAEPVWQVEQYTEKTKFGVKFPSFIRIFGRDRMKRVFIRKSSL
jgi:hypothetical protein